MSPVAEKFYYPAVYSGWDFVVHYNPKLILLGQERKNKSPVTWI